MNKEIKMSREVESSSTSTTSSSDEHETSSEEFFDAEEPSTNTLINFSRKVLEGRRSRVDLTTLTPAEIDSTSEYLFVTPPVGGSNISLGGDTLNESSLSILSKSEMEDEAEEERRRRRLDEMRRRLNIDEIEEVPPDEQTSPSDSQTSSVEGLYGAISGKSSHPFKVVDHDSVSLQSGVSVGRIGRSNFTQQYLQQTFSSPASNVSPNNGISVSGDAAPLSPRLKCKNGNLTRSGNSGSKDSPPEPDLVVSCLLKDERPIITVPVAPPRRKRKGTLGKTLSECAEGDSSGTTPVRENSPSFPTDFRPKSSSSSATSIATSTNTFISSTSPTENYPHPPNSPTVSIRSVCRELDKALESSTERIVVVKAQDEEKTRAKSGPKVLRRTESLPKDVIAAIDPLSGSYNKHPSLGGAEEADATLKDEKRGSLSSVKSMKTGGGSGTGSIKSKSNSAPKTGSRQSLSSIVSAIAALEERKDAESLAQFNIIRTRTDSGKLLSDIEILEQVQRPKSLEFQYHPVLNLDTGERVPLSIAEDKIPKCINPLSLHIMRLTSEYVGQRDSVDRDSDEESLDSKKSSVASQDDGETSGVKKKTAQVRRFLGSTVKRTVDKAKSFTQRRHVKEDVDISTNDDVIGGQDLLVKMKASHSHKGPYDFDHLQQVQELFAEHAGPVWCMKFSNCGRLLATAGQDKIIRIWVLKDHLPYFQDMRTKNTTDKVSPTPSQESIVSQHSQHSAEEMIQACENSDPKSPFVPRPLCTYLGHTADLLDIAWSKSFFLLSSSMDRTVRLWHISRRECLCCFQHIDFVTAIAFHPRDDRYFLSGSLDGKLRLWNIPDKKVALWNEVNGPNNLITAANFCQKGKFAVVGTYDGRCIFYHTEQLKYHTQIIVHKRKRLTNRKITGIEPMPGEDKILVTSNDSRIRLYDLRDLSLTCKYKGFTNSSSQIKGTVSHDGKYIVSGSENQCIYIWKTNHDYSKFSSARRDRNGYWEGVKAHTAVVTSAVFAPDPDIIVKQIEKKEEQAAEKQPHRVAGMAKSPSLLMKSISHQQHSNTSPTGYILVSADFSGCIKVFMSKVKPKHSSLPASALA